MSIPNISRTPQAAYEAADDAIVEYRYYPVSDRLNSLYKAFPAQMELLGHTYNATQALQQEVAALSRTVGTVSAQVGQLLDRRV